MPEHRDGPRAVEGPGVTMRVAPEDDVAEARVGMLPPEPRPMMVDERYRIDGELGRGSMGVVYRATEVWLDRPVALKVIAPSLVGDASAAVRFLREAKALASVRSLHVVQLYAFGPHRGSYFYAMEY